MMLNSPAVYYQVLAMNTSDGNPLQNWYDKKYSFLSLHIHLFSVVITLLTEGEGREVESCLL